MTIPPQPNVTWRCALPELGILAFGGQDAATFLQGQTTNDVRQVTAQQGQINAICTPQGRVIANFMLFRHNGELCALLPQELLPVVQQHLQKYVLRADVRMRTTAVATVCVRAATTPPGWPERSATGSHVVLTEDSAPILRLPAPFPLFFALPPEAANLPSWLANAIETTATEGTDWLVQAGIPWVTAATREAFTPQMLNLPALGAVSFNKGCYTGQEVVARTHYLGKAKRRMYLARMDSVTGCPPTPGAEVYNPEGKVAGEVVLAGKEQILAVLHDAMADGPLHLAGGNALTLLPLPYAVDEGNST